MQNIEWQKVIICIPIWVYCILSLYECRREILSDIVRFFKESSEQRELRLTNEKTALHKALTLPSRHLSTIVKKKKHKRRDAAF